MLIVHRDPHLVAGREYFELSLDLSLQENIGRAIPGGIDANCATVVLNGEKINPLEYDLSRKATVLDRVDIIIRQQGVAEVIIGIVIAIVAAVAAVQLMPKPSVPNDAGASKESPNNKLTGQTNIARAYQAIPDIYGRVRVFPDLVGASLIEYVDNVKEVTELMCVGIGYYTIEKLKYSDTLISTIAGSTAEIFNPGDTIPIVYDTFQAADVDGQEVTPPNLGSCIQ